jgi:hypothetical protein
MHEIKFEEIEPYFSGVPAPRRLDISDVVRRLLAAFLPNERRKINRQLLLGPLTKKSPSGDFLCEREGARTLNQWLKRPLLYH